MTLYAAAGAAAETFRGQYANGLAYAARDVVYVGDPESGPVTYYRAFIDVPLGVALPSFPWGLIATYQCDVIRAFVPGPLGGNRRQPAALGRDRDVAVLPPLRPCRDPLRARHGPGGGPHAEPLE